MEAKTNTPKSALEAMDAYMHIHKLLTGPRTAEKLSSFYESLTQSQRVPHLYCAGWAAAEAAITGTDMPLDRRLYMVQAASDAWGIANEMSVHDAAINAWHTTSTPERDQEFRIGAAQAILPLIEGIVMGDVNPGRLRESYEKTLMIALANTDEMIAAQEHELWGRVGNCRGLAHELNGILAVNRVMYPSFMAWPSIARAGSGKIYPKQTHDFQIVQQSWGTISHITPVEVKAKVKQRHLNRYEAALVHGRMMLTVNPKHGSPIETALALAAEANGEATPEQIRMLSGFTANMIHVAEHHRYASVIGRHCMDVTGCALAKDHSIIHNTDAELALVI